MVHGKVAGGPGRLDANTANAAQKQKQEVFPGGARQLAAGDGDRSGAGGRGGDTGAGGRAGGTAKPAVLDVSSLPRKAVVGGPALEMGDNLYYDPNTAEGIDVSCA